MESKFMVPFIIIGFVFCFTACKDDGGDSAAAYCENYCDKTYDECGTEYADNAGIDESDLDGLLEDCKTDCEPDEAQQEYSDCLEDAYSDIPECTGEVSGWETVADCELALDCDDFIAGEGCEDEQNDYDDAVEEATTECEDALADLDADELKELSDAATECYDSYSGDDDDDDTSDDDDDSSE